MPKKGTQLFTSFDRYTVVDSLGAGGAGTVWSVTDSDGVACAVKVLRSGFSTKQLKRFRNEMMFCLKQNHQNLVHILDFGNTQDGEPFYVMPLAAGTLRTVMRKGLQAKRILPLFSQILNGVEAAHLKEVVHRDLKPENILVDAGSNQLRVADFGIAHFEEEDLHTSIETSSHDRLGNWEYAAPEQRRSGATVGKPADIYSLGLILAEMFTKEVPHGVGNLQLGSAYPEYAYLDQLIDSMRRQNPAERPQSIREVKMSLMSRANDFVEAQKLDRLRGTVVGDAEVIDPLITEPPSLADVKFNGSELIFILSKPVTPRWKDVFRTMVVGGLMGFGPEHHMFTENTIRVRAPEHLLQRLIIQFKEYLERANDTYERTIVSEERHRVDTERNQLQARIAKEEALLNINRSLTW